MVVIKKARLVLLISILSLAIPAQASPFSKKVGGFFSMVCSSVSDQFIGATKERITKVINDAKVEIEEYIDKAKKPLDKSVELLTTQAKNLEETLKEQEKLLSGIVLTNSTAQNLSFQVQDVSKKFELLQKNMQKNIIIVAGLTLLLKTLSN